MAGIIPRTGAYSGTDATSYATASGTPAANKLQLLAVHSSQDTTDPASPTCTQASLTFALIDTHLWRSGQASNYRVSLYRALTASPAAGAVTIDFGGTTQTSCAWSWAEVDEDVDLGGSNGSGAIVQSQIASTGVGGTALALSAPLNAFTDPLRNLVYACWGHRISNGSVTPKTGWSELHDFSGSTPLGGLETQWNTGEDLTPGGTLSAAALWGGVGIEIRLAAIPAAPNLRVIQSNLGW